AWPSACPTGCTSTTSAACSAPWAPWPCSTTSRAGSPCAPAPAKKTPSTSSSCASSTRACSQPRAVRGGAHPASAPACGSWDGFAGRLAGGAAPEHPDGVLQALEVLRLEPGEEGLLRRQHQAVGLPHRRTSFGGQEQRDRAPVVGNGGAANQAARLQRLDGAQGRLRRDAQLARQLGRGDRLVVADQAQARVLRRRQLLFGQRFLQRLGHQLVQLEYLEEGAR